MAKNCNYAGKKSRIHFMLGKKRIKAHKCAPRTKPQKRLAAAARACVKKKVRVAFSKGSAWAKCMKREF